MTVAIRARPPYVQVYLSEEYEAVRRAAYANHTSLSAWVRAAIREQLTRERGSASAAGNAAGTSGNERA